MSDWLRIVLVCIPLIAVAVFLWYGYHLVNEPPCHETYVADNTVE